MELLQKTIKAIGKADEKAMKEARERLDSFLKPLGSLGKLEDIAVKLSGITGKLHNNILKKVIIIMTADNGVTEEGISPPRPETTAIVAKMIASGVAGVGVLARHASAGLKIVDIGISEDVSYPGIINRKVRYGTGNIAKGPAMTREDAIKAIETGIEIAIETIDEGAQLLGTGEMGVGNTTTSSSILYVYGNCPSEQVVGRGAGLCDEGMKRKRIVVEKAMEVNKPDPSDPIDVLAKVGGLDIAGLTGCYLGAASRRVPILIDGFISGVAALVAIKIKEETKNFIFPSHSSSEPGVKKIIELTGLSPMLDMDMRLGEGTGCALAFNIIEAATKIISEMVTVKEAVARGT